MGTFGGRPLPATIPPVACPLVSHMNALTQHRTPPPRARRPWDNWKTQWFNTSPSRISTARAVPALPRDAGAPRRPCRGVRRAHGLRRRGSGGGILGAAGCRGAAGCGVARAGRAGARARLPVRTSVRARADSAPGSCPRVWPDSALGLSPSGRPRMYYASYSSAVDSASRAAAKTDSTVSASSSSLFTILRASASMRSSPSSP